MQLPVVFSSTGDKVIGYGEPSFYLWEVESVAGRQISYDGSHERHFGSREWKKIVEQNGDFSAIHYEMKVDQPIPGIYEAFEP